MSASPSLHSFICRAVSFAGSVRPLLNLDVTWEVSRSFAMHGSVFESRTDSSPALPYLCRLGTPSLQGQLFRDYRLTANSCSPTRSLSDARAFLAA
jgi:hypothetical protein